MADKMSVAWTSYFAFDEFVPVVVGEGTGKESEITVLTVLLSLITVLYIC